MSANLMDSLRAAASEVFDGTPVVFAYLFGSLARGDAHPGSDADIAVYLGASNSMPIAERLRLERRLAQASGLDHLQLTVLDEAPLPVQGRAVRERRVIYSRDEPERVRYESLTLRQFFDFEIHDRPLAEKFLRDIAEGRR